MIRGVLGDVGDRTPFFELQARNRRSSWRLSAVCALIVGGGGLLAAIGLAFNAFLVLFALIFIPGVLLLGLGFLAGLMPAAAAFREPLWYAVAPGWVIQPDCVPLFEDYNIPRAVRHLVNAPDDVAKVKKFEAIKEREDTVKDGVGNLKDANDMAAANQALPASSTPILAGTKAPCT